MNRTWGLTLLLAGLAGAANGAELLTNTGFETDLGGWIANGCAVSRYTTEKHTGSASCRATSRSQTWAGPQHANLAGKLIANGPGNYTVSAWVKVASGTDVGQIQIGLIDSMGETYPTVSAAISNTGWTLVSGTVNLTWVGTLTSASFFVNTTTAKQTLYVDDCSMQPAIVATPTLTPNGGFHVDQVEVTLGCATPAASVYYTTNGSVPTTASLAYSAPFTLTASATVMTFAVKSGMLDSAVTSAFFTITATPTVALPTIAPDGGSHIGSVEVTLGCPTEGASIGYTTDGTTPTNGSPLYSAPFTLTSNATVKVIAWKSGMDDSPVVSADFTVAAATPVIVPNGAEFVGSIAVALDCSTPDATLYYTTNGAVPTAGSTEYSAPFTLTHSATVKAVAVKNGMANSGVVSALFTATPPGSVFNGSFEAGTNGWTLSPNDENPLYYAVTGAEGKSQGTNALVLGNLNGYSGNVVVAQALTTVPGAVYAVRFDYGAFGVGDRPQQIRAEALDGDTVLASLDATAIEPWGTFDPTKVTFATHTNTFTALSSSTVIRFTDRTTVAASDSCDGVLDNVRSSGSAAMPVITPGGGTYYGGLEVTLACGTPGATIGFTTNGAEPTTGSPVYSGPIALPPHTELTIKAIAWTNGLGTSPTAIAAFTVMPARGTLIVVK